MLKVAVYTAAFYFIYSAFLSKDTLYTRNRVFILISVITSFLLPAVTIYLSRPLNIPFFGKILSEVFITGNENGIITPAQDETGFKMLDTLVAIYFAGVAIFGLKLAIDFSELVLLIIRKRTRKDKIIRFHRLNTAGFSAMGRIFVNSKLTPEETEEILKHEQNHLDKHHFADIILIEIVMVIQWFNPVIHLFNISLRTIHEYQADEGCLNSGITVINYQKLLFNQVFRSRVFNITNSFSNPTLIKKRMIMMTKKRSRSLANLKLLIVLPVIAIVMIVFSSCRDKSISEAGLTEEIAPPPPPPPPPSPAAVGDSTKIPPFLEVDVLPKFKGGDHELLKWISEHTTYPETAKANGIQGRVVIRFAVDTDGRPKMASILKGVDPELDAEALRVVQSLPAFETPGLIDGKPVPVWFSVPITFTLK